MKSKEEQACINPIEEQRASALKHYEEASAAIHHWSSFVDAAIKAYNPQFTQTAGVEAVPSPVSNEAIEKEIGFAAAKYAKVEDGQGSGTNATKFNAFTAGCEFMQSHTPEVKGYSRGHLEMFVQQLKDYTREGQSILGYDEREPKEFVDIFLSSLPTPSTDAAVTIDEKDALNRIDLFCIESLPPEYFEKWEDVKSMLMKNRSKLKPLPEPPKKNN